jgi:molecular chaperone DnaJ
MDDIFTNFGDIFETMFGGGGAQQRRSKKKGPEPKQGHDLFKEIEISLKEAYTGLKKEINYHHFFTCQTCNGKGVKANTSAATCTNCGGSGQMQFRQGFFMYAQTCGTCRGEGYTIPTPCTTCKGQTRTQKLDTFSINIPAGIFDGAELRIAHKGDAGTFGGPEGDLFTREGDNLLCHVTLTYPQLVFGCQVGIELIDGSKENIKIPQGSAIGERIVLSGKGFAKLKGSSRGNLIVITKCHIPKKLSTDAHETLMEYSKLIGTETDKQGSIASFFKKFLG